MSSARILVKKPAVAVSANDLRVTLLDLDHLERPPVVLEGSAAAIWREVDGVRPEAEICARLAEDLGLEVAQIEADVRALLDELVERELLVPA